MFYKNIKKITETIALFFVVAYGIGFICWNYYLANFGFFESSFIQTRFLSTGILCILVFITPFLLIDMVVTELLKKKIDYNKLDKSLNFFILGIFILGFFVIFINFIFPKIPQYLGGGKPFAKWIIADIDELYFLSNFNIPIVKNGDTSPPVQTDVVCELYSNNDYSIIGTAGSTGKNIRVLILSKENFKGYQAPAVYIKNNIINDKCAPFMPKFFP